MGMAKFSYVFHLIDVNSSQELVSFMDQPNVITHVALVQPK
jgi:hypothetical protein